MTTPNDGTPVVPAENETTSVVVDTATVEAEKPVVEPVVAPVIKTEPQLDNAVISFLLSLGVEKSDAIKIIDLGVESEDDLVFLTAEQLTSIGMKPIKASKLLATISSQKQASAPEVHSTVEVITPPAASMLEQLPAEDSLLSSLKVGGVLKVEYARVVMAGRCLWARQTGIYGVDKRLMEKINNHYANVREEPNPRIFWELNKTRTRNRYAPIFNALDMPGASSYVTKRTREAFWGKMNDVFIPKVQEVQRQLTAWYDTWVKQSQANLGITINSAIGGGGVGPRQRMPLTNNILASVEAMIDSVNKVFAGQNEVVAIALAVDAQRLRELLKDTNLHAYAGSSSHELMLKELGVASTNDVIQMERDFTTYLHNILRILNLPSSGNTTSMFLQEIQELGETLDWTRLNKKIISKNSSGMISGIGGKGSDIEDDDTWDSIDDDSYNDDEEGRIISGVGGRSVKVMKQNNNQ